MVAVSGRIQHSQWEADYLRNVSRALHSKKEKINKWLLTSDSKADLGYREVKVSTQGSQGGEPWEKNYTVVLNLVQVP